MGFLKKLKETAEKSIEKGVELGTKGYDSAMDVAKKGYEKPREKQISTEQYFSNDSVKVREDITSPVEIKPDQKITAHDIASEALLILKQRFAKGEITKEEFEEMKKMLE